MAQQHLDRLSAVDAAFLHQEGDATHMHIGAIAQFAAPAPPYDDVLEHIRSRLPLVPRYRQKLAVPPGGIGRQRWVDDPRFNLEYHVRHTALPRPGDDERLLRLAGRIFSQRLDRAKPLWELWMVEGLQEGAHAEGGSQWALISKTHHALVDGVSGVDLTTMLFDLEPDTPRLETDEVWVPHPEPSSAELAAASLTSAARRTLGLPLRAASLVSRDTLGGLAEVARASMSSAPDTPLNVAISPHRRIAIAPATLDDFKLVKNAFGGTVNDVVLAVVTGALRDWLHNRGLQTEGLEMKACVPVSTRVADDEGSLGNRITQLIAPLPVHLADPVERLHHVSEAMAGIKESKQALGAEIIAGAQDFAPPTILAQSSRMNFSTRFYNLLVTNIPGPQFPLYLLGRELEAMYPVAFLAGDRALAIAIMSYNGRMSFGLIGDLDAMADIDVVAEGIAHSLRELVRLAA
jgi:diacylglycerol O-acyltransferase / wax synthase